MVTGEHITTGKTHTDKHHGKSQILQVYMVTECRRGFAGVLLCYTCGCRGSINGVTQALAESALLGMFSDRVQWKGIKTAEAQCATASLTHLPEVNITLIQSGISRPRVPIPTGRNRVRHRVKIHCVSMHTRYFSIASRQCPVQPIRQHCQ